MTAQNTQEDENNDTRHFKRQTEMGFLKEKK